MRENEKNFDVLTIFGDGDGTGEKITDDSSEGSADAGRGANEDHAGKDIGERFEQLIRGEFAEEFARRTQKIIDRRFREAKTAEAERDSLSEFERRVAQTLGEDEARGDRLIAALETRLKSPRTPPVSESDSARMEEEARQAYPGFELEAEKKSETFSNYLSLGLSYADAYLLTHRDRLISEAERRGALDAVRSIGSMGGRAPHMNGVAAPVRREVSSLTAGEIRAAVERASRGERIGLSDILG